ncbi:MAG: sigma-70 family RNA polymerase sigma factor [Pirellulaceae bacterium]
MTELDETNTEQLLQRARNGNTDAVDQLFERHRRRLRGMVQVRMDPRLMSRLDPSDVVQETLVVAHKRFDDFLENRPIPFYPWLRRMAWNHLVDLHRRHVGSQKRSVNREVQFGISDNSALLLAGQLSSSSMSPSQKLMEKELKQRVMETLDAMPEDQREIIVMRHLEGMSIDEIAAALDMPKGTVMSRHFRGLQAMRRILDD